jgi:hypothetical protein
MRGESLQREECSGWNPSAPSAAYAFQRTGSVAIYRPDFASVEAIHVPFTPNTAGVDPPPTRWLVGLKLG